MPTTTFMILAAWCFARSSKRVESWLLNHRQFGPPIVAWRQNRSIARRHKIMSIGGMSLGMIMFTLTAHPAPWLALGVGAVLALMALYVARRPEPPATIG